MISDILDIVLCPVCRGAIADGLRCKCCGRSFPVVDGVPDLVDVRTSQRRARWRRADFEAGKVENLLELHRRFFNPETAAAAEAMRAAVARRTDGLSGLVADVAVGLGGLLPFLLSAAVRPAVVAVDIDPLVLGWVRDRAARKHPDRWFRAVASDVRRFAFRDGVYDAVTSNNGLLSVRGTAAFLAEMRRSLKPGGRLLLTHRMFDPVSRSYQLGRIYGFHQTLERRGLRLLLAAAGFRDATVDMVAAAPWADNPAQPFPVAGDVQQFVIVEARA